MFLFACATSRAPGSDPTPGTVKLSEFVMGASKEIVFSHQRAPEELYDVQVDPFETRNLAADSQHRAKIAFAGD